MRTPHQGISVRGNSWGYPPILEAKGSMAANEHFARGAIQLDGKPFLWNNKIVPQGEKPTHLTNLQHGLLGKQGPGLKL